MVGTLETIFVQQRVSPWTALTIRLVTALAHLPSFQWTPQIAPQPAAVWRSHAVRGVHDPRLMYCRLRATTNHAAALPQQ